MKKFQSRCGFSARRDRRSHSGSGNLMRRFNPVLGFLLVATTRPGVTTTSYSFNPVVGFLLVATSGGGGCMSTSHSFNPVLGFLLVATGFWHVIGNGGDVSIPFWVFCSSRLRYKPLF